MPVSKGRPADRRRKPRPPRPGTTGPTARPTTQPTTKNSLPAASARSAEAAKPTSTRYTPPSPKYRFRPGWHKAVGWALVVLGAAIAVVNDLAFFEIRVLPGGHSELYLLLGIAVAGYGSWWLGLFDRNPLSL